MSVWPMDVVFPLGVEQLAQHFVLAVRGERCDCRADGETYLDLDLVLVLGTLGTSAATHSETHTRTHSPRDEMDHDE